jgi:hypothetical protein
MTIKGCRLLHVPANYLLVLLAKKTKAKFRKIYIPYVTLVNHTAAVCLFYC